MQFHAGDSSLDGTFHGQDLPQSSRRVEVDSDQMETLRTVLYHTRDSCTYSKYPNQTLKIICGYVHSFDVWVPHKLCKTKKQKTPKQPFLMVFPNVIL